MPTLEREGATLHYEVYGEGPPLVLAHGAGGNTLIWWRQVPHFAARHGVIVFDHRGFGRSRCAAGARHPRHFAGDLAAILDAEGVERAALVCQSMGGWTGLPFAVAHPERVRALVLCGTPGGVFTEGVVRDFAAVPEKAGRRGVTGMTLADAFVEREPALAHLYERICALNPPDAVAAVGPGLAETRVEPSDLKELRVPTLVIAGTEDAFFSPEALGEVAAAIPGAALRVLEGLGHSTYFEDPETFHAVVDEFLDAHS